MCMLLYSFDRCVIDHDGWWASIVTLITENKLFRFHSFDEQSVLCTLCYDTRDYVLQRGSQSW